MPNRERAIEGHPSGDASGAPRPGRLARALRTFRVGACFVYFGVGAWLLGITVFPLVTFVARRRGLSEDATTRRAQYIAHLFYRSFVWVMQSAMRVSEVHWVNAEALALGPALVVVNHPSLIDTPLLGSKLPQADFLVGPEWTQNPWMRRSIAAMGYLSAESGIALFRAAAQRRRAGRTLVIYPEGSRSPIDGLRPFTRGAAHIALEAGCDILPVTVHVTPRVLTKSQSWTRYPFENPVWRVEVGEPIQTPVGSTGSARVLEARRLTAILEEHFKKQLDRGFERSVDPSA